MAARSVRALLHNQTPDVLTKIEDDIPHGEWGGWRPPGTIAAFSTARMGSESAGFLTGTEARTTYRIGGDQGKTLYLHWDNPFRGANQYHTNTDITHDAFWTALPGNNSVVNYELRTSQRVATDFLPSRDGFKFANHWPDTPYSLPPLRGSLLDRKYGNASSGLCGGIVFAALDYFNANQEIPQTPNAPFGEQDPLFLYLVDRLFDTFAPESVLMMLNLMDPAYPDTDEGVLSVLGLAEGRAAVMAHQQWPAIRRDIDEGRPSPLFIQTIKSILPFDLGHNHQIMAYAYEAQGHDIIVWLYDPNQPMVDDVTMRFDDSDVSQRIVVAHNVNVHEDDGVTRRPIYCFTRMDYAAKPPRIPGPPRVTGAEASMRRIAISRQDITVLEHAAVRSGKVKIFVIPDCGEQEFDYEISSERQLVTVTVRTDGYVTPVLTWTINGLEVPAGEDQVVVVTDADTEDYLNPVSSQDPAWKAEVAGPVTLYTSTHGLTLEIRNTPADGNYFVSLRANCAEQGQPVSSRAESTVQFLGAREKVFGLAEAINHCLSSWYDRLRTEVPSDEALARSVFAQLGRPLDPIWDPDPSLQVIDPSVAELNPDLATFEPVQNQDTAVAIGGDVAAQVGVVKASPATAAGGGDLGLQGDVGQR
jgi:hypothetical protein